MSCVHAGCFHPMASAKSNLWAIAHVTWEGAACLMQLPLPLITAVSRGFKNISPNFHKVYPAKHSEKWGLLLIVINTLATKSPRYLFLNLPQISWLLGMDWIARKDEGMGQTGQENYSHTGITRHPSALAIYLQPVCNTCYICSIACMYVSTRYSKRLVHECHITQEKDSVWEQTPPPQPHTVVEHIAHPCRRHHEHIPHLRLWGDELWGNHLS